MARKVMPLTSGNIVEFGDNVLVERGPPRKTATASAKLLSNDVTAVHYQVGQRDADGKIIELGRKMTYIDWLGERGWYVYSKASRLDPETGDDQEYWKEDSYHDTEDKALMRAKKLAGS